MAAKKYVEYPPINVMCNIDVIAYDVNTRMGHLHLPPDNYPDMHGAIDLFLRLDDEVSAVLVTVGGVDDIVYVKVDGEWEAKRLK